MMKVTRRVIDMLSIDESIAREREVAEMHRNDIVPKENYHNMPWIDKENELNMRSAEYHEQLAEQLEDYKKIKMLAPTERALEAAYNKGYADGSLSVTSQISNKVIDDFVNFANTMPTVETEDGEIRPMRLEEMAKQLKAGGTNEMQE